MGRQRVYVGGLSRDVRERDLEDFFHRYGRINDVFTKGNGFAFVEFDDDRDADDAIHDLDGSQFMGSRVTIERARYPPGARGGGRDGGYGRGSPPRRTLRYSPPHQTRYRIIVENLSTRYTWQDLKDMFRRADFDVTFADAHRTHANEGVICLRSGRDIEKAIEKFQGKEINGREIKLIDDSGAASRSPRRSRSPHSPRRRGRSGSRSRSDSRSRSGSGRRSRSKSQSRDASRDHSREKSHEKSRSKSREKSKSPVNGHDGSKSRSRSRSKSRSKSQSKTPSPAVKREHKSPSGSPGEKEE